MVGRVLPVDAAGGERHRPELRFEGRARVGPRIEVDVPQRDGHGDREEEHGGDDGTEPPSAPRTAGPGDEPRRTRSREDEHRDVGERLYPDHGVEEFGGERGRQRVVGQGGGRGEQRQDGRTGPPSDPREADRGECDRDEERADAEEDRRQRGDRPREQRDDGVEGDDEDAEADRREEGRPLAPRRRVPGPDHADHEEDDPGEEQPEVGVEEVAVGGDEPEPPDESEVAEHVNPREGGQHARTDEPRSRRPDGVERDEPREGEQPDQRAQVVQRREECQQESPDAGPRPPAAVEPAVCGQREQGDEQQADRLLVGDAGPPEEQAVEREAEPDERDGQAHAPCGPRRGREFADEGDAGEHRDRAHERDERLCEVERVDAGDRARRRQRSSKAEFVGREHARVPRERPGFERRPGETGVVEPVERRREGAPEQGSRACRYGDGEGGEDEERVAGAVSHPRSPPSGPGRRSAPRGGRPARPAGAPPSPAPRRGR